MSTYHAPKAIISHPGVEICESGHASGLDYRHDVFLKEGWAFTYGRTAGCRVGHFNSVAEFQLATPARTA